MINKMKIFYERSLHMTSEEMRANPLFMRNTFPTVGKWGMPVVKKQELPTNDIQLLSSADARCRPGGIP